MSFQKAQNPNALLEAMQNNELAIAKLYQAYAERFEMYADFWNGLAQAELRHARCLKKLQNLLDEDPQVVIVQRFSIEAIHFSIDYTSQLIQRARGPEFGLVNAFSLAIKLEEALLEKEYFEVLAGDSQETKDTLSLLLNETTQHFQALRQAYDDYKAQQISRNFR